MLSLLLLGTMFLAHTLAAARCDTDSVLTVTVYMTDHARVPSEMKGRASYVADRAFRNIGVDLEWRAGPIPAQPKSDCGSSEIIEVQLDASAPPDFSGEALAYAQPARASGTRIHVFYDRVLARSAIVTNIFGYVLAHEIGHVLQGVPRHSMEGIMKAKWTGDDYRLMGVYRLQFLPENAEMILRERADSDKVLVSVTHGAPF